ncbi:MAG: hypothetical protein LQ342_003343 [Letrouitia transgressa]|nr:MAG: hypothetical protein LQ342_003343 [Letrouitia transgressa]
MKCTTTMMLLGAAALGLERAIGVAVPKAGSTYEPDGVCKGTKNGKYYCPVVKRDDTFGHCWEAPDGQIHCDLKPRGICRETDDGQVECSDKEKRQECWEAPDGQIHCWVDDDKEKRSSTDDKLTKRSADEIQEVKRSPKKKKGKHHPKPSYPDCGAPICFRAEKKRSSVDDELTKRSADEIQEVKRSPEDFEKTKRDPKKKKGKHHPKPSYPDCGAPICFVKRELLL